MPTLTVTSGPSAGSSIVVGRDVVIVGRVDADLTIADPEVSLRHAQIEATAGGVVVTDLGSVNGTFVNGERISGRTTLTASGAIGVGASEIRVELDVDVGATVARSVPAPPPTPATASSPPPPAATQEPGIAAATPPTVTPGVPAPPPMYGGAAAGRAGLPKLLKVGLPAAAVVTALLVVLLVSGGSTDDSTDKHRFRAAFETGLLSQNPTGITAGGTTNQTPGGKGLVLVTLVASKPFNGKDPAPVTGTITIRLDSGRIEATYSGQAIPTKKTTDILGTGTFVRGTGDYDGVQGTFQFKSSEDPKNPTVAHPTLTGTIEY